MNQFLKRQVVKQEKIYVYILSIAFLIESDKQNISTASIQEHSLPGKEACFQIFTTIFICICLFKFKI